MDRSAAIAKIKAMIALQEGTSFDGEASAAAAAIDRLCAQYGLTVSDATKIEIKGEIFSRFGKINTAYNEKLANGMILGAVANFYDACAYVGKNGKSFNVIGSEAQQIVVKIYYDFIVECMEQEVNKAYEAEKVLCALTGKEDPKRSFRRNFRISFANEVAKRLREMKIAENRIHEHKKEADGEISKLRFTRLKSIKLTDPEAVTAGAAAGSSVSLHKQTTGTHQYQLSGT
jgi:enamine deaminase RidA (YjgF/YER057c/UK114 family)